MSLDVVVHLETPRPRTYKRIRKHAKKFFSCNHIRYEPLPTAERAVDSATLVQLLNEVLSNSDESSLKRKSLNYGGTKHYVLSGQNDGEVLNIVEDRDQDKVKQMKPPLSTPKDPWRAQSILIGPVKRGDKIIGVIEMINKRD